MHIKLELYIVLIHIIAAIIYTILILLGKSHLRREYVVLILLLPIVGPILGLVVEIYNILGKQGKTELDLVPLTLEDDILWKSLKSFHETGNIVPLEEAMLINDFGTRRRIMLNVLYGDPMKYLDVLMIARYNDDIETTHYAITTIAHAQKRFQLSVQELAIATEKNPDNEQLLDEYIEMLEKYIDSGLLEEYFLRNQRIIYAKLLDKKLAMNPHNQITLIKKLRTALNLGNYFGAFEVSETLKRNWKEDENTWIETIRACVEGKDQKRLQETLEEIRQTEITWTKQGKDEITLWLEEAIA